jgi:diguanylate cyclase (GGDEF)-like protein
MLSIPAGVSTTGPARLVHDPPSRAGDREPARQAARLRVYELLRAVQDGVHMPAAAIDRMIGEAERRGWPDVVRAALFLAVVRTRVDGGEWPDIAGLEALSARAEADGEPVAIALSLALRAQAGSPDGDPSATAATDRDLARASAMLETAPGASLEHATSHIECARAYASRGLWELELEHYMAAEAAVEAEEGRELVLPALLYNRAELQVNWCVALRELGDDHALAYRARLARQALAHADVPLLPESWRQELRIFSGLLSAVAPTAGVASDEAGSAAEGPYAGYIHLTRALRARSGPGALDEVERALRAIDPVDSPQVHVFAMCAAAEIESALADRETAGLRYARHLARCRWVSRLSTLASMQSLLEAERLRAEHDLLSQHAYLDDLTRLGNRRALMRFMEALPAHGVTDVALALLDLDDFKAVNDRYGHSVGDETLSRVASILRGAVREHDLAVRLGGDEFLLLLALDDRDAAHRRCEAIVAAIAAAGWEDLTPGLGVRASLGLACGEATRFEDLRLAADAALYRSKAAGGNVVSE